MNVVASAILPRRRQGRNLTLRRIALHNAAVIVTFETAVARICGCEHRRKPISRRSVWDPHRPPWEQDMSSLQSRARRAGVVYAVMSALGAPALLYLPRFIVSGDAAATARRIADGEQLYRLLMLGSLAGSILFIVLGWSLYHLFEQVDRKQAMLMLLFVLVSATLGIIDVALLSPPLVLRWRPSYLAAFSAPQLDALALGLLKIRSVELAANEALWGVWLVPLGMLIIKSRFIPKLIGALVLVASVGYVAMSVAFIAFPANVAAVDRVGMILIQGELSIILWLLIKGARRDVPSRDVAHANVTEGLPDTAAVGIVDE